MHILQRWGQLIISIKMKRLRIIIIIFLIGQFAQSQEQHKFSFDILMGPQVSYRTVTTSFYISSETFTWIDNPRLSFSGGVLAFYKLSNKMELGSGLIYSGKGYKVTTHLPDDIISVNPVPEKIKSLFKFHYLDIPILFVYNFKNYDRIQLFIQTGLVINYFIRINSVHSDYYRNGLKEIRSNIEELTGQRRFNLSSKLGLGLTYVVSERINIGLVPSFDYLILNHFNDDTDDSMHFWNIGGMVVIKYKF